LIFILFCEVSVVLLENGGPKKMPMDGAYRLLESNGFVTEAEVLRRKHEGKDITSQRVKRGMAIEILRSKNLLELFLSDYWPHGTTEDGQRRTARYELFYDNSKQNPADEEMEDAGGESDRFAYEADLRDYLARNLGTLEAGLSPWDTESTTEFQINGRRIDILAKDRNGVPVVIELKVSSGHEKVIGQALYYKEAIKEKLNVPNVRMMIIARDISPELRVATRSIAEVELFEYCLSMTLNRVAKS
jgi:hypothetical protein